MFVLWSKIPKHRIVDISIFWKKDRVTYVHSSLRSDEGSTKMLVRVFSL
jgi:hypothetical protein